MTMHIRHATTYPLALLLALLLLATGYHTANSGWNFDVCPGVCDLAWSPDEDLLAAVNEHGLWLLQADDANAIPELIPFDDVTSVDFSPDGQTIAITACHTPINEGRGCESLIALYELETEFWREVARYDFELDHIEFGPDGTTLAVKQIKIQEWGLRLIDLTTGAEMTLVDRIRTNITIAFAFSPDGRYIVHANGSINLAPEMLNGVTVWDLATGQRIAETGTGLMIRDVMFSTDSTTVFYIEAHSQVTEWHFANNAILSSRQIIDTLPDSLHVYRFAEQSGYLIASLLDDYRPTNRSLYAWDLTTNTEVFFYDMPPDRNIEQIALSTSGQYFSATSAVMDDKLLEIWHIESGAHRQFTLSPDA